MSNQNARALAISIARLDASSIRLFDLLFLLDRIFFGTHPKKLKCPFQVRRELSMINRKRLALPGLGALVCARSEPAKPHSRRPTKSHRAAGRAARPRGDAACSSVALAEDWLPTLYIGSRLPEFSGGAETGAAPAGCDV